MSSTRPPAKRASTTSPRCWVAVLEPSGRISFIKRDA